MLLRTSNKCIRTLLQRKLFLFLTNEVYSDYLLDTSKAYCFNLFKSLNGSSYDYLYSHHSKKIFNSAKLWAMFNKDLTTNVSEIPVVDNAWKKIHKLQCNEVDAFDMFFSNFVTAQNKLGELNSIAITDNAFLRSLLFHKLNIEDLKSDTAQLILKNLKTPVRDIQEDIKKKAKTLSIPSVGSNPSRARRATSVPLDPKKRKTDLVDPSKIQVSKPPPFPKNKGQKLTPQVYNQLK